MLLRSPTLKLVDAEPVRILQSGWYRDTRLLCTDFHLEPDDACRGKLLHTIVLRWTPGGITLINTDGAGLRDGRPQPCYRYGTKTRTQSRSTVETAGNVASAALAAGRRATRVCTQRESLDCRIYSLRSGTGGFNNLFKPSPASEGT